MNLHEKRRAKPANDAFWQSSLNECYDILKPIAYKARYNSNVCNDKITPSKGTIVKSTIEHIIFLESAIAQILKENKLKLKQSSPKTLKYYQEIFAKELQENLKTKQENYCIDNSSAMISCSQWTEIPVDDDKSPVSKSDKYTMQMREKRMSEAQDFDIFLVRTSQESSSFNTPSSSCRKFSQKSLESAPKTIDIPEPKIPRTNKSKVDFKAKCVKSLTCEFEHVTNSQPNQIQEFEGYHCFYKTISELLENVIPLSLAASECVNQFIAKLWSQLPSQERTVYECMATQGSPSKENQIEDADFGISQFDPFPDFGQLDQIEQLMES